jgi:lipopolysaccharide assembly outer membrane protein LptD (OstA)
MNVRLPALLLAAVLLAAAPKHSPVGFGLSDWHISTGQIDILNWDKGDFNAPSPVTLTRPGSSIQADRAVGNFKRKEATLTGHVVLHDTNGVLTNFAGQTGSHAPATLTCDNLQIDGVTKTYVATGNVHFVQGGSDVRADRAVMNGATHDLHLYGHVQLQQ